jgi:hypothetical protein
MRLQELVPSKAAAETHNLTPQGRELDAELRLVPFVFGRSNQRVRLLVEGLRERRDDLE